MTMAAIMIVNPITVMVCILEFFPSDARPWRMLLAVYPIPMTIVGRKRICFTVLLTGRKLPFNTSKLLSKYPIPRAKKKQKATV